MLAALHGLGVTTALTIRPFLPSVPAEEYAEIVEVAGRFSNLVIGGDWYVDSEGVLLQRVSSAIEQSLNLSNSDPAQALYFSTSTKKEWHTYQHPEAERAVRLACSTRGIPFFMGSQGAVDFLRADRYLGHQTA
jgi:hypothetical protein